MNKLKGRKLKQTLRELFRRAPEEARVLIGTLPARQVVNPLFSFLYSTDSALKWQAVTAMGETVSRLYRQERESARVIMRRLMWNLNDESGGIGWGTPEAMGEIIAKNDRLGKEYGTILISYIQPGGNFLETQGLQHGALWGIGRAAHAHGGLLDAAAPFLIPFMHAENPYCRGLSAWAAGPMPPEITTPHLLRLSKDQETIDIFLEGALVKRQIRELATQALSLVR